MTVTPDFTKIDYRPDVETKDPAKWAEKVRNETGQSPENLTWRTMEQIDVKPLYTEADTSELEHIGFAAGLPPFLRGPYPAMYVTRPWTIRQYAGFSTAEESNAFYRRNLAAGQRKSSAADRQQEPFGMVRHRRHIPTMAPFRTLLQILRHHHANVAADVQNQAIIQSYTGILH